MVVEQHPWIDEYGQPHDELVLHYSDERMMILQEQTGVKYENAVDVFPCQYTYVETDEPIEHDEPFES